MWAEYLISTPTFLGTLSLLRKLSTAISTGCCSGSQTPDNCPSETQRRPEGKSRVRGERTSLQLISGNEKNQLLRQARHPRGGRLGSCQHPK